MSNATKTSTNVQGESAKKIPLLPLKLTCPVCGNKDVTAYQLKAKSLAEHPDMFLVSRYEATKKYEYVDFNELFVTTCPKCFFASPDKQDFISSSQYSNTQSESQVSRSVLKHFREHPEERQQIARSLAVEDLPHPRSRRNVILTYMLAIYRASVEVKCGVPYALYKRARYYLKLARLQRKYDLDELSSIKRAVRDLKEVYRLSDFPKAEIEYEVVYLVVAGLLLLKEEKEAKQYLGLLDKAKSEGDKAAKENPAINIGQIDRFRNKARELWERRDDDPLWEK